MFHQNYGYAIKMEVKISIDIHLKSFSIIANLWVTTGSVFFIWHSGYSIAGLIS